MSNKILSNGLYVVSVKKKSKDLAILALTDFNLTSKFIFDKTEKKLIGNVINLKLTPGDLNILSECVKDYENKPVIIENVK